MLTAEVEIFALSTDDISVTIDPGRGADILSLIDRHSGLDVLFHTPWREHADAIRAGARPTSFDAKAGWLEQYRGGWQTLFPTGGEARSLHGAPLGVLGEASVAAWVVDSETNNTASLHLSLFSVPIRIDRVVTLDGSTVRVVDTLKNASSADLEIDYSQHPAFGGAFLDGPCRIETGARRFTSDADTTSIANPGSDYAWPFALSPDGETVDLRQISAPGASRELFGWLHDFTEPWASITNDALGLTARIEWDDAHLPYAWVWQELNASKTFPWFERARAVAIEPASMQTSGPDRRSLLRLAPWAETTIALSITLERATFTHPTISEIRSE